MGILRAIIIDDEQHCIDRLHKLLENHIETISVIDRFSTIASARKGIEAQKPDVVFLDIQLDNGTAFDLLRSLSKIEFQIIFTTAYGHFAIEAIKFSAFDYLLKPIDPDELKQTLQRLDSKLHKEHLSLKIQTLFHNSEQETGDNKKIVLSDKQGLSFIRISDIVRCQADINYTHIFLKDGKKKTASKTLKHFEKLLENHSFFRTHQSHLINTNCIEEYIKEGNIIVMTDKSQVGVSTRRKDAFLKIISTC